MAAQVSCFRVDCNERFVCIKALLLHKEFRHQECKEFVCRSDNCFRKFNLWNSFYKHIVNCNSLPKSIPNPSCASEKEVEVSHTDEVGVNHGVDPLPMYSESLEDPLPMETSCEGEKRDGCEDSCPPYQAFEGSFESLIRKHVDMLVDKWYQLPNMPRNVVDKLVADMTSFLSGGFLDLLNIHVIELLEQSSANQADKNTVHTMFDTLKTSFEHVSTEYKRLKYFTECGLYSPPEQYVIESRVERVNSKNVVVPGLKDVTAVHIPLRSTLKSFFELPHAFDSAMKYITELENDTVSVSNFIRGERWKEIKSTFPANALVFPLFFHTDGFHSNAALGPHCEEITATYCTVPIIPRECQSKLENIFEVLLFNSEDRKSYGNEKTFCPLVEELKVLRSEGVTINLSDGPRKILFAAGLFLGDNLGIHCTCGLTEGFNANFPCRFCKASKRLTETLLVEDSSLLRNAENYQADLAIGNHSLTGIKEKCVFIDEDFNEIKLFQGCDAMHDGPEGVYHYSMLPILQHFHSIDKSFLERSNHRSYYFDYGLDKENQPPAITPEMLSRNKLKMTAAEMATFVRFFGLFVGDLVSEEDEFWHMYLLLHEIDSYVQANTLPPEAGEHLKILVAEHHALYLRLTGNTLKPKHHYLTHYPSVFRMAGPFAPYSSMRYEAKHKLQTTYANVCCSRRNLPLSLARKRQLAKCFRFLARESLLPPVTFGPTTLKSATEISCSDLPDLLKCDGDNVVTYKWVDFNGTRYSESVILITGIGDSRSLLFGLVDQILLIDSKPCFVCSHLENFGFDAHIRGYRVQQVSNPQTYTVKIEELIDPLPLYLLKDGKMKTYVMPRYFL